MSIVNYQTFRRRLEPSSVVDQKVHGMVTYIHKQGREGWQEKLWTGIQVAVWVCLQTNVEFRVKRLDWVN